MTAALVSLAMNEDEQDVVVVDVLDDDHVGFEDVTAEYVLAQVDNDYDEVVVEEPEEVELVDIEHLDVELEVA